MKDLYDHIEDVIATGEKIPVALLKRETRKGEIVFARQLIFTFAVECNIGSYTVIGSRYNKDHATVSHSMKTIYNYEETNRDKSVKIKYYRDIISAVKQIKNQLNTLHADMYSLLSILKQIRNNIKEIEQKEMNIINGTYLHNINLYNNVVKS